MRSFRFTGAVFLSCSFLGAHVQAYTMTVRQDVSAVQRTFSASLPRRFPFSAYSPTNEPHSAAFGLSSTKGLFVKEASVFTPTYTVAEIGPCIGSGSYGTVHFLYVLADEKSSSVDTSSGSSSDRKRRRSNGEPQQHTETLVGKRAWTEDELKEQRPDLSQEKIKDKEARCQYYWSVEKHCFAKIEPSQTLGLPTYRGSVTDSEQRNWLLFDVLHSPSTLPNTASSENIALSLQDLMDRDRVRHPRVAQQQDDGTTAFANHQYLHSTSRALLTGYPDDDLTLTTTLDMVLEQLLEILTMVHAHAIVHRDIKPSNLLIASRPEDGVSRLVLIDFGSAGDLSTAGLLKENIGLSSRVAISPIYAAPEVFLDPTDGKHAVNFDCFSAALLFCQLLFQYLDERTESGFHQQLENSQWDLDVWLQSALQSKVRPVGLDEALLVLKNRPGLWRLLQDMLRVKPADRLCSSEALQRIRKVLHNSKLKTRDSSDPDFHDGLYLPDVLDSLLVCELPTVRPLHFVASFERRTSLGLYLAEAEAETLEMDDVSLLKWKQATADAIPGDVFVQGIVPNGQAAKMGVFAIGDRLHCVGELPLAGGGFERAVEMIQDQPRSAKYVTIHFDRKSALLGERVAGVLPSPALEGPIQVVDQGAWSIKGRRTAQEDAFMLVELHDTKAKSILIAGVLDGHLGAAASNFVKAELPVTFSASLNNIEKENPVQSLLENAWNQCCDAYRTSCLTEECVAEYDPKEGLLMAYTGSQTAIAGTTASVFALDKQTSHLIALNCGDSRGLVIDSNGQLIFQTVDHKPETEIERLTQGKNQGYDYSIPQCRVARWTLEVGDYDYAVARSLEGPFATSKGIVSTADVSVVQALPGMTAIVATDGLWEVIDSEEACRIVAGQRSQRMSAGDTAKALCSLAYEKASTDNISVIILYLD